MVKIRNFRYRFLIERSAQLQITGYQLVISTAVLLSIYFLVRSGIGTVTREASQANPSCAQLVTEVGRLEINAFDEVFLLAGSFGLLIGMAGGILVTHRVVGPILRLRQSLSRIEAGEPLGSTKLRPHDFFSDLLPQLKRIIDRIEQRENSKECKVREEDS